MTEGKPTAVTGCPATCDRFPDGCTACPLDCYAAGEWTMDQFDDEPEIRVSYQDDWSRPLRSRP